MRTLSPDIKARTLFLLSLFLLLLSILPASALAHKRGYDIWPVPQQQIAEDATVATTAEATLIAGSGCDPYTVSRAKAILTEHGIKPVVGRKPVDGRMTLLIGVNGSGDLADKTATRLSMARTVFAQPKYDRHAIAVAGDKAGNALIVVLGENTDAVFCGLASVEQMLDEERGSLRKVRIYDYADTQYRGVIEGYYGVPYSKEATEDLFRFMARYKMNTYMYGAKSDPYHSRYWDKPYPTTITEKEKELGWLSQDMLRSITDVAHQCKVNFIWAIHPGQAFTDSTQTDVLQRIMSKLADMHRLGVRQFGVFVDDVGVPDDQPTLRLGADRLTRLQQLIDQKWNFKKANPADTVKPLHFVPQLYAYSWVDEAKAKTFFESLAGTPSKVNIYITGRAIWTVPNSDDPAKVSGWLGREVAWWWNYPCNDNDMDKLFMLDTYRNFADEAHIDRNATLQPDLRGVKTLISNPMQQGTASKVALFGVGDYGWNRKAFDNERSWVASLRAVFGSRWPQAFRLMANISTYDQSTRLSDCIRAYKSNPTCRRNAEALLQELGSLASAADSLATMGQSAAEADRLLWHDIKPFVCKMGDMCRYAAELVGALSAGDASAVAATRSKVRALDSEPRYMFNVLNGMGDDIQLSQRVANPSAKVLRPFLGWLDTQLDQQ
ncbi:MAG: beta-N-acetylglucosaminidase domain-containing protein [Prevotella sp.]|nr:beta-N-acetylglucosaminidase domain-containing protein [Prevotella sp.]